ncbi:putative signal peptide protein [Puccinia sorghi]|uniref:Putative signal peptide protein n=1 Tax=Puccinia sorghi TaxID=27349 RepID=A0A0L6UC19_9BASI|nr:putative signal peptide protein [Puccinia sorghi]
MKGVSDEAFWTHLLYFLWHLLYKCCQLATMQRQAGILNITASINSTCEKPRVSHCNHSHRNLLTNSALNTIGLLAALIVPSTKKIANIIKEKAENKKIKKTFFFYSLFATLHAPNPHFHILLKKVLRKFRKTQKMSYFYSVYCGIMKLTTKNCWLGTVLEQNNHKYRNITKKHNTTHKFEKHSNTKCRHIETFQCGSRQLEAPKQFNNTEQEYQNTDQRYKTDWTQRLQTRLKRLFPPLLAFTQLIPDSSLLTYSSELYTFICHNSPSNTLFYPLILFSARITLAGIIIYHNFCYSLFFIIPSSLENNCSTGPGLPIAQFLAPENTLNTPSCRPLCVFLFFLTPGDYFWHYQGSAINHFFFWNVSTIIWNVYLKRSRKQSDVSLKALLNSCVS